MINKNTYEIINVNDISLKNHSLYKNTKIKSILVKLTDNGFITKEVYYE